MNKVFISYRHSDARDPQGAATFASALRVFKYDVFIAVGGTGAAVASSLAKILRQVDFAPRLFIQMEHDEERERQLALRAFARSASCALVYGPGGKSPLADDKLRSAIRERYTQTHGAFRPIPVLCRGPRPSDWMEQLKEELSGVDTRPPVIFDESVDLDKSLRRLILAIRGLDAEPGEAWQKGWLRHAVRLRAANVLNVAWDRLASEINPLRPVEHNGTVAIDFGTSAGLAACAHETENLRRPSHLRWVLPGRGGEEMVHNPSAPGGDVRIACKLVMTPGEVPRGGGRDGSPSPDDPRPGVSGRLFQYLKRYVTSLFRRMGADAPTRRREPPLLGSSGSENIAHWKLKLDKALETPKVLLIGEAATLQYRWDGRLFQCATERPGLKHFKKADVSAGVCFIDGLGEEFSQQLRPTRLSTPVILNDSRGLFVVDTCVEADKSRAGQSRESPVSADGYTFIMAGSSVLRHAQRGPRGEVLMLASHSRGHERLFHPAAHLHPYGCVPCDSWPPSAVPSAIYMVDGLDENGLAAVASRFEYPPVWLRDEDWRGLNDLDFWRQQHLGADSPRMIFCVWHVLAPTDGQMRLWIPSGSREEGYTQMHERGDTDSSLTEEGTQRQPPLGDLLVCTIRPPA